GGRFSSGGPYRQLFGLQSIERVRSRVRAAARVGEQARQRLLLRSRPQEGGAGMAIQIEFRGQTPAQADWLTVRDRQQTEQPEARRRSPAGSEVDTAGGCRRGGDCGRRLEIRGS